MKLSNEIIIIDSGSYRVKNFEPGIKLTKGIAYRMKSMLHSYILPYRGKIDARTNEDWENLKPGIYSHKHGNLEVKYPTKKERKHYHDSNVRDLTNHNAFDKSEFIETDINLTVDGDIFRPEVRADDDANNKIFKVGLNLKGVNLDWYGPRLEQIDSGTNIANRKSNAKRAIMYNNSMSSQKLSQYAPVFDFQYAIILANSPGSLHPMPYDKIVHFPNGEFDICGAIPIDSIKEDWEFSSIQRNIEEE